MSRYVKKAADKTLVYGTDHALGYFYEEWLTETINDEEAKPFADRCQMFGMKVEEFSEKLIQYRVKDSHREAVKNKQPF